MTETKPKSLGIKAGRLILNIYRFVEIIRGMLVKGWLTPDQLQPVQQAMQCVRDGIRCVVEPTSRVVCRLHQSDRRLEKLKTSSLGLFLGISISRDPLADILSPTNSEEILFYPWDSLNSRPTVVYKSQGGNEYSPDWAPIRSGIVVYHPLTGARFSFHGLYGSVRADLSPRRKMSDSRINWGATDDGCVIEDDRGILLYDSDGTSTILINSECEWDSWQPHPSGALTFKDGTVTLRRKGRDPLVLCSSQKDRRVEVCELGVIVEDVKDGQMILWLYSIEAPEQPAVLYSGMGRDWKSHPSGVLIFDGHSGGHPSNFSIYRPDGTSEVLYRGPVWSSDVCAMGMLSYPLGNNNWDVTLHPTEEAYRQIRAMELQTGKPWGLPSTLSEED